ncbi:MAG TPA: hypothetical protein VK549_09035, partial [Acidimicrobiia bacterium]|nr:hypothetical protein [Acidimicrobiia bacterium]
LTAGLRAELTRFEADRWSGADCVAIAEELARVEKACAVARVRASERALECNARDVEWVARSSGSTPSAARTALTTVKAAGACSATNEALTAGSLSLSQAAEIVRAESAVPGSAAALLKVAETTGMAGLREEARRVVLGSIDRDELHRRQVAARSVRHWVDGEGMVAGQFRLHREVGVRFVNRLDVETDRVHRAARRAGSVEPREAHAADALLRITKGGGKGRAGRADVVYVCDLRAAARGHTHGDEVCHVVGGGPVPVSVVRAAAVDAFVKVVVRDGTKVDTIVHYGRHIPALLRTVLELGDPERLDGAVCVEDGCDRRHDLEWDHDDPVANHGVTSYENLRARCKPDHWAKTERDRKAGKLSGGRAPPRRT